MPSRVGAEVLEDRGRSRYGLFRGMAAGVEAEVEVEVEYGQVEEVEEAEAEEAVEAVAEVVGVAVTLLEVTRQSHWLLMDPPLEVWMGPMMKLLINPPLGLMMVRAKDLSQPRAMICLSQGAACAVAQ